MSARGKPRFRMLQGAWQSAIRAARNGSKRQAQDIAAELAYLLDSGKPLPDVARNYLVDALAQIGSGVRADKAMNTAGMRGKSTGRGPSVAEIGAHIAASTLRNHPEIKETRAFEMAEEEINAMLPADDPKADASSIRQAYKRLRLQETE